MTIKIDRMELDEAGGNPERIAAAVLAQIPGLAPPVPIEEIARGADIVDIQHLDLAGYEGCLITWDDKYEGRIIVNRRTRHERQRYTIGHELGHFLNPWHEPINDDGFHCSAKDMLLNDSAHSSRAIRMEVEANIFAAELLFPKTVFLADLRRRAGLDLDHVLSLAHRYDMSKEATSRRYVDLHDEPCAVVFSRNGVVRYWSKGDEFPSIDTRPGQAMPQQSLAARHNGVQGVVSDWDEVDGGVWLSQPRGQRLCEQTLAQANGFRMTLIALSDDALDNDDEGEDAWEVRFRR